MTMRNFYIKTLPLVTLMFLTNGFSQLPIEVNHPSQILIKRYSALGDIPLEYFGNNSISKIDANNYLSNYENDIIRIHKRDIQLAKMDSSSTNSILKHKIDYLLNGITNDNFNKTKEYFSNLHQTQCLCGLAGRKKSYLSQIKAQMTSSTQMNFI